MAGHAALVVGTSMAAVAAIRVKLSLDLVHGNEIAAVLHLPVRSMAVFQRRLHFNFIGMAVGTEGALVTGGAETVVAGSIEAMVFYERRRVAESAESLQGPLLLVFMAFRTVNLLADGQGFGMGSRQNRDGFHLGAGGEYHDQPAQNKGRQCQLK